LLISKTTLPSPSFHRELEESFNLAVSNVGGRTAIAGGLVCPSKYGIPSKNVENPNFIEKGRLVPDSDFVTRPAPPSGNNPGGKIEVVVPLGGVKVESHISLPIEVMK
jgi:hypothetical protein